MRDGGIVRFYELINIAEPGAMPVKRLNEVGAAFFAYRTTGVNRRYQARGAGAEFDFVVRCFNTIRLPDGTQYAILDGDEHQYQIDVAEPIVDYDAIDLTLVRMGELYEVNPE